MDLGVLKGPAELLASKIKAFKNCLQLATECLTNKDYGNSEMIYGGILADLHKDCFVEALNLNDLEVFSLHSCFAYSSIGTDYKSEQALVILNSIHKPIKLPLVPYLKAFVHISNDRLSFAHDELQSCQTLLNDGYNFKPNSILNEDIVPEINDEFLKLKINGLKFACELLKAKGDNDDLKRCFKENWMKIGKLCDTDFAKFSKKEKENEEKEEKATEKEEKEEVDEPPREMADKKLKNKAGPNGAVKKTEKQNVEPSRISTSEMGMQTIQPKVVNVGVQTKEKEANKQLLAAVLDIKNKMSNMQSKKDTEIKQLQKKNNELSENLMARDNKHQERSSEFEFLKEQMTTLERKYEQSQKQVEFLQKLLIEQLQQKYNMQKSIYQLFEEKCDYKIVYLCDVQKYLHHSDRPTPEECKQEVTMWKNTLAKVAIAKKDFEVYYRTIDDLIVAKKYSTIKSNDWPGILNIPNDVQDIIYRNFKIILQQSKSLYSLSLPNKYNTMVANYGHFKENEHNPNYFMNGYNGYKEDGRTTGSPNYSKFNPSIPMTNGHKQPQFSYNQQHPYNLYQQRPQQQPVQIQPQLVQTQQQHVQIQQPAVQIQQQHVQTQQLVQTQQQPVQIQQQPVQIQQQTVQIQQQPVQIQQQHIQTQQPHAHIQQQPVQTQQQHVQIQYQPVQTQQTHQQLVQNNFSENKFEVPSTSPTINNDPLGTNKSDQSPDIVSVMSAPPPPPPSVKNINQGISNQQELVKFLQVHIQDVSEVELLQAAYQVREINGGSLLGFHKKALIEEIRKILNKTAGAAKTSWNSVSIVQWQNDHSDNKCCICFEEYDASNSHSLPCQHEFHKKCITNWLKRQSACPVCRIHAVIDEEYPPLKV